MSTAEREIIEAAKFYLNKLITENDSHFIITALEKSNYDVKKEDGYYRVKSKYKNKDEILSASCRFSPKNIEIFIKEENKGLFNDHEIIDSSYTKERYALYEVHDNIIDLNYKQSYVYHLTTSDGNSTTINPVNVEENIKLEFVRGENNLLKNYNNIVEKSKGKVLSI